MQMNVSGGLALAPSPLPRTPCASWEGGHLGRHAGWKPAPLEPHSFKDPRHNVHHPSEEGIKKLPSLEGWPEGPGWVPFRITRPEGGEEHSPSPALSFTTVLERLRLIQPAERV